MRQSESSLRVSKYVCVCMCVCVGVYVCVSVIVDFFLVCYSCIVDKCCVYMQVSLSVVMHFTVTCILTLQALLSDTFPPNSAVTGYTTEGSFFISVYMSTEIAL